MTTTLQPYSETETAALPHNKGSLKPSFVQSEGLMYTWILLAIYVSTVASLLELLTKIKKDLELWE